VEYRRDRRRGVPAGAQLVAVDDDERLAGEVGQVGSCQLAQFRASVLQRLDQAGAFGLVRGEFPSEAAAGCVDLVGVEEAVVDPVLEFTRG
jgi:hypothetical protein